MAVGADQAPVQAHLPASPGGDHGQLGGLEVRLDQAVLFVQQLHDVQLYQVAAFAHERFGAKDHIQLLALDALGQGLLHLIPSQVDQQIRDHQHGIPFVFADGDSDHGAVLAVHHAVDGQGDGGPLILLNAAVVMGLEVGDLRLLIERIGLDIQPGRVHMGGADVGALAQRLSADDGQGDGLIPVIVVDLVAGLCFHTGGKGLEAQAFRLCHGPGGGFPLGLAGVHKGHVALAVIVHGDPVLGVYPGVAVLGGRQQGLPEFFCGHRVVSPLCEMYGTIIPSCRKNARHLARKASSVPVFSST